ncbi:MAG: hypothetical protein RL189_118 [Pseudomonadota bacterium]|jgi:uncharacterized protein (DUF58 family)
MKLAELCTAFPETAGSAGIRHPGSALPHALRLKLRAQRGHLQASLDTHPQRSANRLGLGLRPYESGDSLRAVALRPLLLQEQLLTRTDVSAGRFHVSIIVHSYANMNFKSDPQGPSKNQLAWATAGILQNLHDQQAQKVDLLTLGGADLPAQMIQHAARIRRSHFCYVVTDLLFNSNDQNAAAREISAALSVLHLRRGMVIVIRDPLESPEQPVSDSGRVLTFEPPQGVNVQVAADSTNEKHSGEGYVANLRAQVENLQQQLNSFGWNSFVVTATDDTDHFARQLSLRLAGQRICQ